MAGVARMDFRRFQLFVVGVVVLSLVPVAIEAARGRRAA
jgi:hypothetical protein